MEHMQKMDLKDNLPMIFEGCCSTGPQNPMVDHVFPKKLKKPLNGDTHFQLSHFSMII